MPKVEYKNVIYDSQGELNFKHWLDEAFENGLIEGYRKLEKGIDTFELIGKQHYFKNGKRKHCFASVTYTPDFIVTLDTGQMPELKNKDMDEVHTYIDIKGDYSPHNDEKQFSIIRKMMFKFHGIYVHKIIPDDLFIKTWIPEKCRYTPVKGDIKKKFLKTPTIKEYLKKAK